MVYLKEDVMEKLGDKTAIEANFLEFDQCNPEVWEMFKSFARELICAGQRKFSADAILHRIRWQIAINNISNPNGDRYKINNNFSAFYARKWRTENREFADFFSTRSSIADRAAERAELECEGEAHAATQGWAPPKFIVPNF